MPTLCLSVHAGYRCRHVGECCRAGWDVDVEPHILEAVASERIEVPRTTPVAFMRADEGPGMAPARTPSGDCGFHHDCRCSLQLAGGEGMLPSACRHFPRVYLRDARGDLLTLSHFCPTAAALLLEEGPVQIVEAQPPLALSEPIEGLDAREALPPLLRPGMLTDIAGYTEWEGSAIATFVQAEDAHTAISVIARATDALQSWTPSAGALRDAVREAFAQVPRREVDPGPLSPAFALVRELTGPHPLMAVPPDFDARWRRIISKADAGQHGVIGRYLAASTFANWVAYRGQGLRSIVAWVRGCHDVLRVQMARAAVEPSAELEMPALLEAIRMTDYIMVHTVDSLAFGRAAACFEG